MLRKLLPVLLLLASSTTLALAQDSDWIVRGRILSISPDDESTTILDTGTGVTVDSATSLEVDLTYMFNESWGLEIVATYSSHDLETTGGALGGLDAGSVDVLPPTFSLQYFFDAGGRLHPYVGVGLNYTTFPSYDLSSDLEGAGVADIDFDDSIGFAAGGGLDIDFGTSWLLNLDVKYVDMSTDAEIRLDGGGTLDTVTVDINPWLFGVGVGYRF